MGNFMSRNSNDVDSFGFTANPVQMSTEEPSRGISTSNIAKMHDIDANDHYCIICDQGGKCDIELLLEQFLEAKQNHVDDPYIAESSKESKSSSDDSLDSSSSQSRHGKKKVKKSLTQRNSTMTDEKIKQAEEKNG